MSIYALVVVIELYLLFLELIFRRTEMKKLAKTIGLMLAVAMILILLGCSSMQDAVTPEWIPKDVGLYTGQPMTSIMPYTTIADAKRLGVWIDYVSTGYQIQFERLSENDLRKVANMKKIQRGHHRRAAELKNEMFSPTGTGSILLGMLPAGILGSVLIRRPGDVKKTA